MCIRDRNQHHERKSLVHGDFHDHLRESKSKYSIINFDVILHHILTSKSYSDSRRMQANAINLASESLQPSGYITIRELAYQTFSVLPKYGCHRLLWFLTTRQFPSFAQRYLQRLGMKSQGAGVCFFHENDLPTLLETANLELVNNELVQFAKMGWRYWSILAANSINQYVVAKKP